MKTVESSLYVIGDKTEVFFADNKKPVICKGCGKQFTYVHSHPITNKSTLAEFTKLVKIYNSQKGIPSKDSKENVKHRR